MISARLWKGFDQCHTLLFFLAYSLCNSSNLYGTQCIYIHTYIQLLTVLTSLGGCFLLPLEMPASPPGVGGNNRARGRRRAPHWNGKHCGGGRLLPEGSAPAERAYTLFHAKAVLRMMRPIFAPLLFRFSENNSTGDEWECPLIRGWV